MDLSAFDSWKFVSILAILLVAMLVANVLKKKIPFLNKSLIPTSVLGGLMILVFTTIWQAITGNVFFDQIAFSGESAITLSTFDDSSVSLNGSSILQIITYHCLALGFIATSFKSNGKKLGKERTREIFNSGVTTVSTYLLQAGIGLGLTILIASTVMPKLFPASGALFCFGYGQGTGQALNYGTIYQTEYGFVGGSQFGLATAALGFLSACIGGVFYLNHMRNKGKIVIGKGDTTIAKVSDFQSENEIPLSESMDKFTVQVGLVLLTYGLTYLLMLGLKALIPSMSSMIFGFNFLLGVLMTVLVKWVLRFFTKKGTIQKQYVNDYLMNRLGGFLFDLMVIAGIAAINLFDLVEYWWVLLLVGVLCAVLTFVYNIFIAKVLFKGYYPEQFLVMYGMLTGTASTGIILLREADPEFKTPASDNLVFQQFVAIIFGLPMMVIATLAPKNPLLTFGIVCGYFVVLNLILFRNQIFRTNAKQTNTVDVIDIPTDAPITNPDNDNL